MNDNAAQKTGIDTNWTEVVSLRPHEDLSKVLVVFENQDTSNQAKFRLLAKWSEDGIETSYKKLLEKTLDPSSGPKPVKGNEPAPSEYLVEAKAVSGTVDVIGLIFSKE